MRKKRLKRRISRSLREEEDTGQGEETPSVESLSLPTAAAATSTRHASLETTTLTSTARRREQSTMRPKSTSAVHNRPSVDPLLGNLDMTTPTTSISTKAVRDNGNDSSSMSTLFNIDDLLQENFSEQSSTVDNDREETFSERVARSLFLPTVGSLASSVPERQIRSKPWLSPRMPRSSLPITTTTMSAKEDDDDEDNDTLRPASLITGKQTLRLSVFSVHDDSLSDDFDANTTSSSSSDSRNHNRSRPRSFGPRALLDVESGDAVLVADDIHKDNLSKRARRRLVTARRRCLPAHKEDYMFFEDEQDVLRYSIALGSMHDLEINNEVGILGGAWRGALKRLILLTSDDVNARRLTRLLQLHLPFQTGYESYLTSQVIESLDRGNKQEIAFVLTAAFQNRNVSRVLVQSLGPRFDFLWHWSTAITWNRPFDAWGQFPVVGFTRFPATENFPSTRDHALASIFRVALGEGSWVSRLFTRGREGLITDNPNNLAQNLAAESNNFEVANRNQYGTFYGRMKTNQFRFQHRLPTDESIVRTFVAQPMPTMTNNGVVHTLRQLAKHWHNMLSQEWGNFAHQRMEQLDPFETLRFHMPEVLVTLSSLRGRNVWDSEFLGPMIRDLEKIKPGMDAKEAKRLVRQLQNGIVMPVTGGIASVVDPFRRWLDAIGMACDAIEDEAHQVYEIITSVEIGIRLGYDIMTQVNWKVPSDAVLKQAILDHILGNDTDSVNEQRIRKALEMTTPRDKRTLIELVQKGFTRTKPAKLLLKRVKTLLQRELRREVMNDYIRSLSVGSFVHDDLIENEWYWLEEGDRNAVHVYCGGRLDNGRFIHVESGYERIISVKSIKARTYVPVAEAISRAQKAFMTIELDHGRKFSYNAFMEFSFLRIALRRLIVVSQMTCEALDNARLNVLSEIQRCSKMQVSPKDLIPGTTYYMLDPTTKTYKPFVCQKKYTPKDLGWLTLASNKIVKKPPQNLLVVGGGPTGLMTTIHCSENCLASGGVMKLYEARDAFLMGGSTFERAQIVRLDSRWIAMLRYHLGTAFEDVFIPASGETDSQLGNNLPTQGFVEISIKDLENVLHVEVSRLWSRGIITVYTDSKAQYDLASNKLSKYGENLKVDDLILRRVDADGKSCKGYHSWKVVDLTYTKSLGIDDLRVGEEYGVFVRAEQAVLPFKLVGVDLDTQTYTFRSLSIGVANINANARSLPSVYPAGTDPEAHANVQHVVLESVKKGGHGGYTRDELPMKKIKSKKFALDIGYTHVVEAIGKPRDSEVSFLATTTEPYGVCCLQGLKVSMRMHQFGEKRWGSGLIDDFRSLNDQNTRIVGDFTKAVRVPPIIKKMSEYISSDANWQASFFQMTVDSGFPELNEFDPIVPKIISACALLVERAETFRRQTLQTRFFETGDGFYLGMELNREYDEWKKSLTDEILFSLSAKKMTDCKKLEFIMLKDALMHQIDRLFYSACLSTIKQGDVYNPGARHRVPDLHLINSCFDVGLGNLPTGESFRLSRDPDAMYEILVKTTAHVVVRSIEGYVSVMNKNIKVKRESNLTRAPDGNQESRVALATFPVGHYVNYRTMRVSNLETGYSFAFNGDSQATPHFMRYSGLSGAAINAMSFNAFIKKAIEGVPFIQRFQDYSRETNWSNGEVVQRGTGANYGLDGFLRPGFSYMDAIDFLHSKVIEYRESGQDPAMILSHDWKVKFAASFVPRGMEMNECFRSALHTQLQHAVFEKFIEDVKADAPHNEAALEVTLRSRMAAMDPIEFSWSEFLNGLDMDNGTKKALANPHALIAKYLTQVCMQQIPDFAREQYLYNRRFSSELFNQPKPVDSIVDDFAVEAQNFANSLTLSSAFAAGTLAFRVINTDLADTFSALLGVLNIAISFGTMTNVARYKIRNEEARLTFMDEKLAQLRKAIFSLMDRKTQTSIPPDMNPFIASLERNVERFYNDLKYYGFGEPTEFAAAYSALKQNINDIEQVVGFQELVCSKFIADVYQINSYVQESLVEVYRSLEDIVVLMNGAVSVASESGAAKALFDRLNDFEPRLAKTMQRGPVRWGFIKQRRVAHWDIMVAFRYFFSLCFCSSRSKTTAFAPIETDTLGILKQTRALSVTHQSQVLRREIRDLEALFWATRESDNASLIFLAGFLVFSASIVFTVARITDMKKLEDAAFWALLASAFPAVLATMHLVRKFFILTKLWNVLGSKVQTVPTLDRGDIRKVRSVTFTQILLTLSRLLAAGTAAVALPFSVAEQGYRDKISTPKDLPFWIALVSVLAAVGSTIFFFAVEFSIRYNLSPELGPFVCESFREEIESMHRVLTVPFNHIDTKEKQEKEAWEYTAREFLHEYRFDTVFAADRFGQILQYIQAGMKCRTEYID